LVLLLITCKKVKLRLDFNKRTRIIDECKDQTKQKL